MSMKKIATAIVITLITGPNLIAAGQELELTINPQYMPLIQSVWATGGGTWPAYYSININGVRFPGDWPLAARWNMLRSAIDWNGKKIIELGCNVALTSILLKKYCKPMSVCATDRVDSYIRIADTLAKAVEVELHLVVADFDRDNYEELLGTDYDIAICTSLFTWINDKARFLRYLSNFKFIVYEGHENDEIEMARFRSIGFDCIKILGKSERKRTIILFGK